MLPTLGPDVFILCAALCREAAAESKRAWKMVPNFHMCLHRCEWQGPVAGSPACWWTYADEDMVGHMVKIAKAVHPRTMAHACMYKWVVLFFDGLPSHLGLDASE